MADQPERLPNKAETLLASFPVPEHDFESQATSIDARLRDVLPGSTDARLLEAPFPDELAEIIDVKTAEERAAAAELALPTVEAGVAPQVSASASAMDAFKASDSLEMSVAAPASAALKAGDSLELGAGASDALKASDASKASDAPKPGDAPADDAVKSAAPSSAPEAAAPLADSSPVTPSALARSAPLSVPAPPLPSSSGGQSLAALARSVAQKTPRPQSNDLAKESLSVAAAARAHTDVIVERVRGSRPDTGSPPSSPPSAPLGSRPSASTPSSRPSAPSSRPSPLSSRPSPLSSRPSAPVASHPSVPSISDSAASEPAPSQPPRARDLRGPWLAVAAIGFTAAAAIAFIGRSREPAQLPPVVLRETVEVPARAETAAPAPMPTAQAPSAPAFEASPAIGAIGAIGEAAPASPIANEKSATVAKLDPRSPGPASVAGPAIPPNLQRPSGAAVARTTPNAASPPRPAPEAVVLEETPSRSGAGGGHNALRPASGTPSGGLPQKPSTGAVQAALGSVMTPARACLGGSAAAAPAQVTFGSDGSVKSVNVTGPIAGSPAASCIEGALRRARVAPFAAAAFSLGVWVRP